MPATFLAGALVVLAFLAAGAASQGPAGAAPAGARVALVFEHAGRSLEETAPVFALRRPLGLGIYPRLPASARIAAEARSRGFVPILHLPMEPRNPSDIGPVAGGVWVRMTDVEIRREVESSLDSVPGVVGVSNHAGSRATADARVMRAVLGVVRARGLWFAENRTNPASVATAVAKAMGVPSVLVTTYLDDPPAGVERKVRGLLETARRTGAAAAVAHITTGAPSVVMRLLPEFDRAGVRFVPITEFVR